MPVAEYRYAVVIPTHARRDLVLQALESVHAQTHAPAEVVVVVDGDVDGTAEAVRAAHPSAQVVVLDGNTSSAGARNAGIAASTAPWVAFLDDDDLWHRDMQARLRDHVVAHPTCEALRPEFWLFHEPGAAPGGAYGLRPELVAGTRVALETAALTSPHLNDLSYLDIEGDSLRLMLERNRGVISGSVVRRDVLDRIPPIPAGLRRGQDWLLFIHVAALTEWHLVPERLVFTRLHDGQITRTHDTGGPEHLTTVLTEAWDRYGSRPGVTLADYGREYSGMVQGWVWNRLRRHDLRGAWSAYRHARRFLPSPRDRARALLPVQVTHRLLR